MSGKAGFAVLVCSSVFCRFSDDFAQGLPLFPVFSKIFFWVGWGGVGVLRFFLGFS